MPKRLVKDAVGSALEAKSELSEKVATKRQADDLHQWRAWKENPSEDTLQPLLRRLAPVFRNKEQQLRAPNVSSSAMRAHMKLRALDAFNTYDPERSALRTHVENHLRKAQRFNAQHQNYAYIPEWQSEQIGPIDRARDALMDVQGFEPTHGQIAAYINSTPDLQKGRGKMTARTVATVQGSRRNDVLSSSLEGDPVGLAASRAEAVLGLLPQALTPEELVVFNHIYGRNGAPTITASGDLARKLGKSVSQVSRLKSSIADKYKRYL